MQNLTEVKRESGYAWYALGLLTFVYILNFLDRQIIYMLFQPIKAEMAFSDLQLALLGTTSFAIFYTFLGIPFGKLADKSSRTKMIAIGLAVWSIFSGLTGFATDFWTIFACRVMVGVGEATLGPAAISLLADYFSPSKRATVTSIYSMGIAIGAGFAAIFGGYLSKFGWRPAFFIVGFPGAVFAILVFLLREPARSVNETPMQTAGDEHIQADAPRGLKSFPFVMLCLGYGLLGLATNNLSIWGATYFNRIYTIDLPTYGYWAGVLTLVAGIPATTFGGVIADKFRKRSKGGRMYFGALLALASFPCWLIALFSNSFYLIIPAGALLLFAALSWLGAAAADATEISGSKKRGLAVAIYFFTVNIAAYGIGSNLIGVISDTLGSKIDPTMLRYALLVCPVSCLLAAFLLWRGGKSLEK